MKTITFLVPDKTSWLDIEQAAQILGSGSYTDQSGVLTFLPKKLPGSCLTDEGNYAHAEVYGTERYCKKTG